jgi:pimeloyl-ACP methyl ester carboxylesterase
MSLRVISQEVPPTGRLIDVGGFRMHIDIRGNGSPAVIMIAGSQAFSFDWALVVPDIAKITTAITYDRPCLAWSDPGPMPRTLSQDVYELHTLLQKAGVKPPYVMVGHSLGGIIARFYEKRYPGEVAGMVLVDGTSENTTLFINNQVQRLRLLSQNRPVPDIKTTVDTLTKVPSQKKMDDFLNMIGHPKITPPFDRLPENFQRARLWAMSQPKYLVADDGAYWAEEFEAMHNDSLYSMGSKPLIIITSGKNNYPESLGDSIRNELLNGKLNDQRKMTVLSSNHKHIITYTSGHEIHLEEPVLVIDAIKNILKAIKTGKFSEH